MPKRRIVIAHRSVGSEALDQVRALSADLEVVFAPFTLGGKAMRAFATQPREVLRGLTTGFPPEFLAALPEAEVIYGVALPVDVLERAPRLRWMANALSGSDHLTSLGLPNERVVMTSSKGVAAASIAEFVLAQLLALFKGLPQRLQHQRAHRWQRLEFGNLRGATLGIVGLGEIGTEVARLAQAFGMRVLAARRRPGAALPAGVDAVYPPERLREMLAQCDAVALTVAYTPQTRRLLGAEEFAAMRQGAFVVNVSRGEVLDEEAFASAVRGGHLGGGALDVFVQEPLPAESPLWDLPNVIISAHNPIGKDNHQQRAVQRFIANLERYLRGEVLQYQVDPLLGY
jgi:phosphoglycerate dehydrogenase-like enzyme